jgi:hypothetical protein
MSVDPEREKMTTISNDPETVVVHNVFSLAVSALTAPSRALQDAPAGERTEKTDRRPV